MARSYQLGDAQIDAQNQASRDIGAVVDQYGLTKNAGQLTPNYIQAAMSQLQSIVNNYKAAYGGLGPYGAATRGSAGAITLQTFLDGTILPGMVADLSAMLNSAGPIQTVVSPSQVDNQVQLRPYAGLPNTTNISVAVPGISPSFPSNVGPSLTPYNDNLPQIPGVTMDVTASAPTPWWYYAIGAGLLLAFMSSTRK